MKVVVAGGQGFIGSHIVEYFKNHEVIILSRHPKGQSRLWDPVREQIDPDIMENVDLLINVTGKPVRGKWTHHKILDILKSRVTTVNFLTKLIERYPPKLFCSVSSWGYYPNSPHEQTETASFGDSYLAMLCYLWEMIPKRVHYVRQVNMRFGTVIGRDGGVVKWTYPLFKAGLGGVFGKHRYKQSWIAVDEIPRIIEHIVHHPEISGPVNFTMPDYATRKEFIELYAKLLNRPAFSIFPSYLMGLFASRHKELTKRNKKIRPDVLLRTNYKFLYPTVESALKKALS